MKLKMALDEKLMDVRLRDRLVAEGKLNKDVVDNYITSLTEESSDSFEKLGGELSLGENN